MTFKHECHAADPFAGVDGLVFLLSTSISPEHNVVPRWREVGATVKTVFYDHVVLVNVSERKGFGD